MKFPALIPTRRTGAETFAVQSHALDITVLDFWQWSASDLLSNATRGILAELIVASALGLAKGVRNEWDPYDLKMTDGKTVEVKASGYIQSWGQKEFTRPVFGIAPSFAWDPETNSYQSEKMRQADIYIFCLLHHKDQATINPLDLDQWTFYLLQTSVLNTKLEVQKTITLSSLRRLGPVECNYSELAKVLVSL